MPSTKAASSVQCRSAAIPTRLALTPDEEHLLVVDSRSGDVAVVRTVKTRDNSKISADRALVTLIPVGNQPNDIVIKAFQVGAK